MSIAWNSEDVAITLGAGLFLVLGTFGSLLYASSTPTFVSVASCTLAVGGASFLLGCLIGFLFGIPRPLTGEGLTVQGGTTTRGGAAPGSPGGDGPGPQSPPGRGGRDSAVRESPGGYGPNTNLDQVSDWLTKILIGVGLTQLAQVPHAASALGGALAPILGNGPQSGGFGVALALYFSIGGFFITYLWTRLKLGREFRHADLDARFDAVDEELGKMKDAVEVLGRLSRTGGLGGSAPPPLPTSPGPSA